MTNNRLKIGIDNGTILAEIHHTHVSLQNIKSYIKDNFAEYYFGRSNIVIYQDILASKELNEKREKLVNWFIKNADIEENNPILADRIASNYKKQIKIKIGTHEVMQDITTIRILRVDQETMSIEVRRDSANIIFNYLKSRFIFGLSKYDRDNNKLFVLVNAQGFNETISGILSKKSIVGKKVIFIYDRRYIESLTNNSFQSNRRYVRDNSDSIKEYMTKIRESYTLLELTNQTKDLNTIKKQYYKMAKKLHPDNFYSINDESTIEQYRNRFMQVKEAYEILKEYLEKKSA